MSRAARLVALGRRHRLRRAFGRLRDDVDAARAAIIVNIFNGAREDAE